jgi:uncharacterized membrane protein
VFGAGTIQTMIFNIVTLGAGIIVLMAIFFPLLDKVRSAAAIPTQMDFRFPNGEIAHAYPLVPVSTISAPPPSNALHAVPYIILFLVIMAHLLRRMFAVGVFNFGFDRIAVSRSLDLRAKIIWGGVVAAAIAVIAPLVLGLLGF